MNPPDSVLSDDELDHRLHDIFRTMVPLLVDFTPSDRADRSDTAKQVVDGLSLMPVHAGTTGPGGAPPTWSEMFSGEPVPAAGANQRRILVTVAAAVMTVGALGLVGLAARSDPAPAPADSPPPSAVEPFEPGPEAEDGFEADTSQRLSPEELFVAAILAPGRAELDRYDRAVAAHRSACMATAGFDDAPKLSTLARPADAYAPMVDSLYETGRYLPGVFDASSEAEQAQPTISPAMSAALDRCNQPVIAIVQQAYRENDLVGVGPDIIDGQIFDAVVARPEVAEKTVDWERCMITAGFSTELADPRTSTTAADQAEASVSCLKTTRYAAVVVAAQAEEVARWASSNQETINTFKQLWADLADAAEGL